MARSARYVMTARRKAALRKAQLASAKKRKRNRRVATAAAVGVVGGAVVARHKLSGSKISYGVTTVRTIGRTGAYLGSDRPGGISHGPGLDINKKPYHYFSAETRTGRKRGVGILGAIAGQKTPLRGKRLFIRYEHRALLGKKTKSIVPKIRENSADTPDMSNGYHVRMTKLEKHIKQVSGGATPITPKLEKRPRHMASSTTVRSKNPTVRRIMNELNGTKVNNTNKKFKVIFE